MWESSFKCVCERVALKMSIDMVETHLQHENVSMIYHEKVGLLFFEKN